MNKQHLWHGSAAGHKTRGELIFDGRQLNDARQQLEDPAKRDANVSTCKISSQALASARNDAIGALQAIQEGSPSVDVLRAICLHVLGDSSWQKLAESILESAGNPAAREAMGHLLGRKPDLT